MTSTSRSYRLLTFAAAICFLSIAGWIAQGTASGQGSSAAPEASPASGAVVVDHDGQELYGHYQQPQPWPQPLPDTDHSHAGWTRGSQAAVFAESFDDFIVVSENNFAEEWPERFRSSDMPLELSEDQLKGLRELNIMGGGQPSEKHLRNIIERSKNPVVVLDFRQEPHSHIAGISVTWFRPYVSDRDLGTDKLLSLEDDFIDYLKSTPSVQVDSVKWTGGQNYEVLSSEFIGNGTVLSNAEMVEKNGARYMRFHVPVVPSDRQVAEFEAFVEEVSDQDLTLYFHCWDGTGRSTEFMVMYDILKNGGELSLETIADRHAAMGGINVLKLPPQSSPNYPRSVLRRDFIIDYYQKKSEAE